MQTETTHKLSQRKRDFQSVRLYTATSIANKEAENCQDIVPCELARGLDEINVQSLICGHDVETKNCT